MCIPFPFDLNVLEYISMKSRWTRLNNLFCKGLDHRMFYKAMDYAFKKHHQQADEIIFDEHGQVVAAVYKHPITLYKEDNKAMFKELRTRWHNGLAQWGD